MQQNQPVNGATSYNIEPSPLGAQNAAGVEHLKHSGIGIAAFILSVVAGLLIFVLLVVAGAMEASNPGGIDEDSAAAVVVGLCLFGFLFLAMVSLGLGIVGLIQKGRKKLFAILGTIFSVCILIGTGFILLIGLLAG